MMLSIDLKDRTVLVIGSTPEAVARSKKLSHEGAKVILVSTSNPDLGTKLEGVGFSYQTRLRSRTLKGVFMVVATDRDRAVNKWLYKKSRKLGFLLNTLDEKATSNFYHVAVRRIHPVLEIAVSTNGASPAFASRLSTQLANQVNCTDIAVLDAFISTRTQLKCRGQKTFDFDWTGLENRVRSQTVDAVQKLQSSSRREQSSSFGVEFTPGVKAADDESWPIAPIANNLLEIRLAQSSF